METESAFMSRLDRDSYYRINALRAAVDRAGQDGGLNNEEVDVLGIAETYFAWLSGEVDTKKPSPEKTNV